jgi:hypothetical protein
VGHLGHRYEVESDHDDDVVKIDHTVVLPDGSRRSIPFTPYRVMSSRAFAVYVEMGCPPSRLYVRGGNFDNETLEKLGEFAANHGIVLSDHDTLRFALKMVG